MVQTLKVFLNKSNSEISVSSPMGIFNGSLRSCFVSVDRRSRQEEEVRRVPVPGRAGRSRRHPHETARPGTGRGEGPADRQGRAGAGRRSSAEEAGPRRAPPESGRGGRPLPARLQRAYVVV